MKPEEQRIAIAEACGWKQDSRNVGRYGVREDGWWSPINGKFHTGSESLPDYLRDLNAMHGAVETLRGKTGPEWFDFQRLLMIECGSWMNCIQASAALRAEVFLKTLNLWEEDEFEV